MRKEGRRGRRRELGGGGGGGERERERGGRERERDRERNREDWVDLAARNARELNEHQIHAGVTAEEVGRGERGGAGGGGAAIAWRDNLTRGSTFVLELPVR